jgi:hypothetical protein
MWVNPILTLSDLQIGVVNNTSVAAAALETGTRVPPAVIVNFAAYLPDVLDVASWHTCLTRYQHTDLQLTEQSDVHGISLRRLRRSART